MISATCPAQNSAVHITQLSHKAWPLREGILPGMPDRIVQTKDGYLWLGTENGLYRFDGQQFEELAPSQKYALRVNALLPDRDGGLWISSHSRFFHWKSGILQEVPHSGRIQQMLQSPSGEIWAAVSPVKGGNTCQIHESGVDCFKDSAFRYAVSIAQDQPNSLWVTDGNHIENRKSGKLIPQSASDEQLSNHAAVLASGRQEMIWAGTHAFGKLPVLIYHDATGWHPSQPLPGVSESTDIQSLLIDREGATWVGTSDHGLYRVNGAQVDRFDHTDGLSAEDVRSIFQDTEGSVWVVTSMGLDQFHRSLVDSWTAREGLTADSVSAILADHAGRVWMANQGGLDVLDKGQIRSYRSGHGLPGMTVAGLAEDHLGRIWLGLDRDLYIFDGKTFKKVFAPGGKSVGLVVMMQEDTRGRMWVQVASGLLLRDSPGGLQLLPWADAYRLTEMEPDGEGGMWLGARGLPAFHVDAGASQIVSPGRPSNEDLFEKIFKLGGIQISQTQTGLSFIRDGKTYVLNQGNGVRYKRLGASEIALNGDFYAATEAAYLRIPKDDMARWLRDPSVILKPQVIGTSEGAFPGFPTFAPASSKAPNGDIWFATDRFPQKIEPSRLGRQQTPPALNIEAISADDRKLDLSGNIRFPAGVQSVSVRYAALTFLDPQTVEYKYMLQGFDSDWQPAGTRRQAIYTHLPPGSYTFLVTAQDASRSWNTASKAVTFFVAPHFYQTVWFKVTCFFAVFCVLWAVYLARLQYLVRQAKTKLLARMAERERIARDLHDTFFQGIQGILLRFHTGTSAMPPDEPRRPLFEELLKQSDQVMLEGRELVLDLREQSPENSDPVRALTNVCAELEQLYPCKSKVIVKGKATPVRPAVGQEIFFIAREALMNAFQHSGAKDIEVEVIFDKKALVVRIRDDGNGLDADVKATGHRPGHFGLLGMRERAKKIGARLDVWSQVDAGTEVDLRVPASVALRSGKKYWSLLLRLKDTHAGY